MPAFANPSSIRKQTKHKKCSNIPCFLTQKLFPDRKLRGGHWRSQSESAARLSRPACRILALHGEAHAELPVAVHACSACMPRAKPYWGTTNQGYLENVVFATPPTRKRRFPSSGWLKPQPPCTGSEQVGALFRCFFGPVFFL